MSTERIVNRTEPNVFYKLDEEAIKTGTSDLDELLQATKQRDGDISQDTVNLSQADKEDRTNRLEQEALKSLTANDPSSPNFWQDRIKPDVGPVTGAVQTVEAARAEQTGKVELEDKQFLAQQVINDVLDKAIPETRYSSEAELWSQFLKFKKQVVEAFRHLGVDVNRAFKD